MEAQPPSPPRAFTGKAIVAGLIGALVVAAGAFLNNELLRQTPLIGNHLPAAPYALVLLLIVVWNPVLGRFASWLRFSTRELAVTLCLMLLCAWLAGSGFYRYAHRAVIMPPLQAETRSEWKKHDLLAHLPADAFPLRGSAEAEAVRLAVADERAALAAGQVPQVVPYLYVAALDRIDALPAKTFLAAPAVDGADASEALARSRVAAAAAVHLPAAQERFDLVYNGFVQGIPSGDQQLPIADVPWRAWLGPIQHWLPLVACFALAVMALSLVVHRQWMHHEQLAYPIAQVSAALIETPAGGTVATVLRSRLFWAALIPVLGMHLLNYAAAWFPGQVPVIPLRFSMGGIVYGQYEVASKVGDCGVQTGAFYFAIIGLAYFISAEVSLSMGLSSVVLFIFAAQFYLATGRTVDQESSRAGAYVAFAAILLYTGRRYYLAVAWRALGLGGGATGDLHEPVWAARLLLAALVGLVWTLAVPFGMDWFVAILFVLALLLMFLVFTRIICETGVPFLQTHWNPIATLGHSLGLGALGTAPLVVMYYLYSVLASDPRENLMPFASTSWRLADQQGIGRLRLLWIGAAVMAVALAVGFVAWGWGMYQHGAVRDSHALTLTGRTLDMAARAAGTLADTGQEAGAAAATGLGKLALLGPAGSSKELGWMGFGALAVIVCALARFRFGWWPLHPVLFLVWGTWAASNIWLSFLVGWALKALVVRFGGGRSYQDLKPLAVGLIGGELAAVALTILFGVCYYFATGLLPRTMNVFPG